MIVAALLSTAMFVQAESFVQKIPESTVEFKMVALPGGTVAIGNRNVEVKPVYMGATEVTWEMFDQFLLSGEPSKPYDQTDYAPDAIARPSRTYILPDLGWGHAGYPVINVSHTNVMMFCRWLSSVTQRKFRLPTEAEWEHACRAGATGDWKLDRAELDRREWHFGNSEDTTHPVGKKAPNAFGLYDMLGNAGEWATDMTARPVLCGSDFKTKPLDVSPTVRRYWSPKWQETDPQIPKSRWWLSDGSFVGFRLVCEE